MSRPLDFNNKDTNGLTDLERQLPMAPTHKPAAMNEDDVKKLILLTNCARGEALSALLRNDHNLSFALIDIASAEEKSPSPTNGNEAGAGPLPLAGFSTPSKKPSAAGSSNRTTQAKSSSAKKRPSDMNKEEFRAHRRGIERESKMRCRAREKEQRRILEGRLERAFAVMSPSQRKEAMVGDLSVVVRETNSSVDGMVHLTTTLANLTQDTFATLDDDEAMSLEEGF